MSHPRTATLHTLPRRVKPWWKLQPAQREALQLCPHCGEHDPQRDHFAFGCKQERIA